MENGNLVTSLVKYLHQLPVAFTVLCQSHITNRPFRLAMNQNAEPLCLDYFSTGVPSGLSFEMALDELAKACDRSARGLSRVNEICFIGLVSYFEAFCKDHFASIINIEPTLLKGLRKSGHDTSIDPERLLNFRDDWIVKLGFLVSEKYDFGTAQKINALFMALLKISPFSKDEAKEYEEILRDRNLLVHHGGTITLAYANQTSALENKSYTPYYDSLVVTADYFDQRLKFIRDIAAKLRRATHSALNSYIHQSGEQYSEERKKALDAFLWRYEDEPDPDEPIIDGADAHQL
ncbi:hypothetical protein [Paraburkholderia sp. A1RO-5L]|uniref:hypothetical protein n=1 Tax=unclassified Paraburkholderia TaxID=2615204 RepID=UPI003B790BF4